MARNGNGMLPQDYREFKDSRRGETAWVIASGSSVDHINPAFFNDKLCVCVNFAGMKLGLTNFYSVTHYWLDAIVLSEHLPELPIITPHNDLGGCNLSAVTPTGANVYRVPTGPQRFSAFDVNTDWPHDPDAFVAGPTSLHMTMHFAAYLVGSGGSIVLVGADCGTLDGASNFAGYTSGDNPFAVWAHHLPIVADRLRSTGVAVHSLNPWVNPSLEGHVYRSPITGVN